MAQVNTATAYFVNFIVTKDSRITVHVQLYMYNEYQVIVFIIFSCIRKSVETVKQLLETDVAHGVLLADFNAWQVRSTTCTTYIKDSIESILYTHSMYCVYSFITRGPNQQKI